ncbi:hypothetical protein ACFCW2_02885 [Qipengyuania sp. DSG2-2]|uniref:hypothetical protein n=1 Tax=Qipengyuania sp. DGS2-2 TaxID=3349631 RepID=UPI0036D2B3E1
MDGNELYERTKKALGLAITLVQLAIALSFLLFVFTLEDSFSILSIVGILDGGRDTGLWLVWPVVGFVIASLIVSQILFIRRARALFASEDNAIACFGTTTNSTSKSLDQVRTELTRYALVALPLALVIALFIRMPFVNVLLGATLSFILIVLFLFYRDNAKLLRCDEELLS